MATVRAPMAASAGASTASAPSSPSTPHQVPAKAPATVAGSAKLRTGCTLAVSAPRARAWASAADDLAPLQWNSTAPGARDSDAHTASIWSSLTASMVRSAGRRSAAVSTARPAPMKAMASRALARERVSTSCTLHAPLAWNSRPRVRPRWPAPTRLSVSGAGVIGLKARAGLLQERQLLGAGTAAQDHVPVADGVIKRVRAAGIGARQRLEQLHRPLLHARVLGMLEGHVGEPALQRRQLLVGAAVDQAVRRGQRQRIPCKRLGLLAVGVAGELVEHEDAGQGPARPRCGIAFDVPFAQAAGERDVDHMAEARADYRVKSVVLLEPFLTHVAMARIARRQKPEIEYVLCQHACP